MREFAGSGVLRPLPGVLKGVRGAEGSCSSRGLMGATAASCFNELIGSFDTKGVVPRGVDDGRIARGGGDVVLDAGAVVRGVEGI